MSLRFTRAKLPTYLTFIFYTLLFITGVIIYKDYGAGMDEMINVANGMVSTKYVMDVLLPSGFIPGDYSWVTPLHEHYDRDYGVVIDMPLVIIAKMVGADSNAEILYTRHLAGFLLFYGASICLYLTTFKIYCNRWLALSSVALLVLSPRIFAASFVNLKDLTLLSLFIIAGYCIVRLMYKKSVKNLMLMSLTAALCIDLRILGIIWIPVVIAILLLDMLTSPDYKFKTFAWQAGGFLLFLSLFTIAFWPYLWEDPIGNFIQVFENMSKFSATRWNGLVLYFGEAYSRGQLPWHYIPVYIVITVPVLYTILFSSGVVFLLYNIIKGLTKYKNVNSLSLLYQKNRFNILFLTLFTGPLLAIIVLNSVVYGGWRHLYFIYFGFVMLATSGIYHLTKQKYIRYALVILFVLNTAYTSYFMIKYHPHQQVYFNTLAGKEPLKSFEGDYWIISSKQVFEFLSKEEQNAKKVLVLVNSNAGNYYNARDMISNGNLFDIEREEAYKPNIDNDRYDTVYSIIDWPVGKKLYKPENDKEVFSVVVQGNKIIQLIKLTE